MKENEYEKLFDNAIRKFIEKSLEELYESKANKSYAERVFEQILMKNNITDHPSGDDDFIEISYSELENIVKHEFIKRHGERLEKEIEELKRRLGQ